MSDKQKITDAEYEVIEGPKRPPKVHRQILIFGRPLYVDWTNFWIIAALAAAGSLRWWTEHR